MRRGFLAEALLALLLSTVVLLAGCPRFQQRPSAVAPTVARELITVEGGRIFVRDVGHGTALLLVHGYGSAHDAWDRIIPGLARDHRVLAVDLPGFGRSDKYAGDYSPVALARKLKQVLDAKGIARAHVVAHSWGSSIAMALALDVPQRVASLTLVGAWVFEEQLPPFIVWSRAPVLGEILYGLFYDQRIDDRMALAFYDPEPFVQPQVIDRVRAAMRRPGAIAAALAAARGQRFTLLQRRYPQLKQRVLLIWGRQDRVSRVGFGQRLHDLLPSSRLVVLERCGHIPQLERPAHVLRELRRFLQAAP